MRIVPCACMPSSSTSDDMSQLADPERKLRVYGRSFGGASLQIPRRRPAREELLELAVLNERLAGKTPSWEARKQLEFLKIRRRNWQAIHSYVTQQDAAATLDLIAEASRKVQLTQLATSCLLLSPVAHIRTAVPMHALHAVTGGRGAERGGAGDKQRNGPALPIGRAAGGSAPGARGAQQRVMRKLSAGGGASIACSAQAHPSI